MLKYTYENTHYLSHPHLVSFGYTKGINLRTDNLIKYQSPKTNQLAAFLFEKLSKSLIFPL